MERPNWQQIIRLDEGSLKEKRLSLANKHLKCDGLIDKIRSVQCRKEGIVVDASLNVARLETILSESFINVTDFRTNAQIYDCVSGWNGYVMEFVIDGERVDLAVDQDIADRHQIEFFSLVRELGLLELRLNLGATRLLMPDDKVFCRLIALGEYFGLWPCPSAKELMYFAGLRATIH
jgi:hypothetical protein